MPKHVISIIIDAVTKGLEKALGSAKNKVDNFGDSIKKVSQTLIAGAISLALQDMVQLGAASEQARMSLDAISQGRADEYLRAVQEASQGTISQMDAFAASARAVQLGVVASADEMAAITERAIALGRIMGVDSVQAINDFVYAAGRQNIVIADNIGLIMRQERIQAEAQRLMREDASLTKEAAEAKAFLNEMLRAGDERLQQMQGHYAESATQLAVFEAQLKDTKTAAAEFLAVTATEPMGGMNEFIRGGTESANTLKMARAEFEKARIEAAANAETYEEWREEAEELKGTMRDMHGLWTLQFRQLSLSRKAYEELRQEAEQLAREEEAAAKAQADLAASGKDLAATLYKAAEAAQKAKDKVGGLKEEIESISGMTGGEDIFGFEGLFDEMDKAGEMAEKGLRGAVGIYGAEGGEIDELAMERAILSFMKMRGVDEAIIIAYMIKTGLATEDQVTKWKALMALVTALQHGEIGLEEFIAGTEMVETGNIGGLSSLGMKIPEEGFTPTMPGEETSAGSKDVKVSIEIKDSKFKDFFEITVEEEIQAHDDEVWDDEKWLEGVNLGG